MYSFPIQIHESPKSQNSTGYMKKQENVIQNPWWKKNIDIISPRDDIDIRIIRQKFVNMFRYLK